MTLHRWVSYSLNRSQIRVDFRYLLNFSACQFVTAIILRTISMTGNLDEFNFMLANNNQQQTPQILIFNRFTVAGLPSPLLPVIDPALLESIHNIRRIRMNSYMTPFFQCSESADHRKHFHTVVCGVRHASAQFLFMNAESKHSRPSPGPRIAGTRAVRIDINRLEWFRFRHAYLVTSSSVSRAITISSLVGMTRTFTLLSAAEISASLPRTAFFSSSILAPRYSKFSMTK